MSGLIQANYHASPPNGAVYSAHLKGIDEYWAGNGTPIPLGFSTTWSISQWTRPVSKVTSGMFTISGATTANQITMIQLLGVWTVTVLDSAGTIIKQYDWDNIHPPFSVWKHLCVTYDQAVGTGELKLYIDKVDTAPTRIDTDIAGVGMTDTARYIQVGKATLPFFYQGHMGHSSFFSNTLNQTNIDAIADGKFSLGLKSNDGGYTSSGSLEHYYRPGFDPAGTADGSEDEGNGTLLDMVPTNITAADIEAEAP